jgi:hypothetical protein
MGNIHGMPNSDNSMGSFSQPIWMDNLHCRGTETQLKLCRRNGWGQNNCGHWEDQGLECDLCTNNINADIRLKDRNGNIVAGGGSRNTSCAPGY